MTTPKPPIGLLPKEFHDKARHIKVCKAICRYYNVGLQIPITWVEEYNEYIKANK